ncbi:MAG: addA [Devosia sp.]|uniref:double-strand break repair helicase AddA n=1 Tax=Devosia sp. TaxID=1871048 RepID=UPI002635AE36|nr:double-strand break repair helicase AddA [Devosia sp.]MDB5528718.1 addA [Devosia sp.]
MRGKLDIPAETLANQAKAADPAWSIWVEANAGSGKTHVLTQRVLRLLLADVAPQSILCLTYTKAAAAEMRRRVSGLLASWAIMPPAELELELRKVVPGAIDDDLRALARTLFAKALETPGGLKIVTIHAFCESVLHRFPLEAAVPFDFSVIEEEERAGMVLAAREMVLASGLKGGAHAEAVETLFGLLSDFSIAEAIDAALADGRKLKAVLADRAGAKARLRALTGFDNGPSSARIAEMIVGERLVGQAEVARLLVITTPKVGGNRFEDRLARLNVRLPTAAHWMGAFLKDDGTVPSRFPVKAVSLTDPALAELLLAEAERLAHLAALRRHALLIERSEAVLDVVGAISDNYEARKRARALLDFDDLVQKLGDLFENSELGPWVQYKLDAGIDHILVDESQDTNPEQWRVVRAIADEFFRGASAVQRPRSLFAVGDQKQSIYSFQGAEPALFGETGQLFKDLAADAKRDFAWLPLHTSFRTLRGILEAVDKVSDREDIQQALLSTEKVHHDTARSEPGGMVTLWPPLQQLASIIQPGEWPTEPVDAERTAPRQVAERIAGEIADWIATGRPLANRGKAVTADDVLILVQSRNALFQEIIRALRRRNIPTPGADRLKVTGHIAVLDLLALCDVLLNPADDLQLAALLRSPLFDISEDELFALAQPRAKNETLWQALHTCVLPECIVAFEKLSRWRRQLDFERPFEFLAAVLYAEGGLKRFHARLGTEVDEVFAELLELALGHEQTEQPSLQGFVAEMRARDVSIKRELAEAGSGVRVMTVHGAKGLEAPIVILADAASKPAGRQVSKPLYVLAESPGPLLIHASGEKNHVPQTLAQRDIFKAKQEQEYWRKLYVGMTRAEDELYVTGALTAGRDAGGQLKGTWYEAIEGALRPLAQSVVDAEGKETALIYPLVRPAPKPVEAAVHPAPPIDIATALQPLPAYAAPVVISPSSVHVSAGMTVFDSAAERVADADTSRKSGIALHALLQHLPKLDPALWPVVVPKAMPVLLPALPGQHQAVGDKAIAILARPELAHVFGTSSRAEVAFALDVLRGGAPVQLAGRIDRLIVDDSSVLVVDYKSDAAAPAEPEQVPQNYQTQLGLYALVAGQLFPGRTVRAAILWTALESLMELPPALLAEAAAGFTLR